MTESDNTGARRNVAGLAARLAPLAILAGGIALFFALGLGEYLSFDTLKQNRAALTAFVGENPVLAPLAFIGVYVVAVAFSLPLGALLTVSGGFVFGIWWGTLWVVLGATLGATLLFVAIRAGLGDALRARAGDTLKRMEAGFADNAFSYLLVLRLVPLFPFWLVNIVPALLNVPLRTFMLATAIGIVPGSFVYATVGNGAGAVFDEGRDLDLGIIFRVEILLPILGLALLALVPVVYRTLKAQRAVP